MSSRNSYGLATWAKWLIGIFATLSILTLAGLGIGAWFIYDFANKAADPENAKKVADGIVTMAAPLGDNYKYSLGIDIPGLMTLASVEDETTKTSYSFMKLNNTAGKGSDDVTAEDMVEEIAKRVPTGSGETSSMEVEEKGTMTVAGLETPYVLGKLHSKGNALLPALLGCVMPSKEKVILLMALNPTADQPIDLEAVKEFFSSVKAFK
ncbi:MAG: hypothetical protein K8F91_21700 [Candidatus Obscuribacterales bacterium]|nr:hypothetical protein [Candidatus Obscuribacterales bacterium]